MVKKTMLIAIIIGFLLNTLGCTAVQTHGETRVKARIIQIDSKTNSEGRIYDEISLEVLEGEHEREVFTTTNSITIDHYKNLNLYHKGDRVYIDFLEDPSSGSAYVLILSQVRETKLLILFGLILLTIVLIAGIKGIKTIVALIMTIGCVVYVLIPMVTNGCNPILCALLCSAVIATITLIIVGGINKKTLSAVLGTLAGLVCAILLTISVSHLLRVTGITSEEVEMLAVSDITFDLDVRGIFTAGIFIGCLGAVMDVGMSLASSINEIKNANPIISKKRLYHAGMRVGKDIMGTMANTLILAYTGGALMQLVVWRIYGYSFLDMLNIEYISTEIIRALCGSFGMLLTIPVTCFIAVNIISWDVRALLDEVEIKQ